MSEVILKPAGEPGKWSLLIAGAFHSVPLSDGLGFWVDLEDVTDDNLQAVMATVHEYLMAKASLTDEDVRGALLAIHRRRVVTWWCIAVIWMVVVGVSCFMWGKAWRN